MAPLKSLLALFTPGLMPWVWAKPVHFDLNLTWQRGAPDGSVREMIFMNDQYPGPELRLDQGDDVVVRCGFGSPTVVQTNLPTVRRS